MPRILDLSCLRFGEEHQFEFPGFVQPLCQQTARRSVASHEVVVMNHSRTYRGQEAAYVPAAGKCCKSCERSMHDMPLSSPKSSNAIRDVDIHRNEPAHSTSHSKTLSPKHWCSSHFPFSLSCCCAVMALSSMLKALFRV